MKTLAIYYSYTGHTKRIAQQIAEETGADLYEIKDSQKIGMLKAYSWGCFKAMRMQNAPVQSINVNLDDYEKIMILAPVWAGHPAPQILSVFNLLPSGKEISFHAVSATGRSRGKDKVLLALGKKGCKGIAYQDVKV